MLIYTFHSRNNILSLYLTSQRVIPDPQNRVYAHDALNGNHYVNTLLVNRIKGIHYRFSEISRGYRKFHPTFTAIITKEKYILVIITQHLMIRNMHLRTLELKMRYFCILKLFSRQKIYSRKYRVRSPAFTTRSLACVFHNLGELLIFLYKIITLA